MPKSVPNRRFNFTDMALRQMPFFEGQRFFYDGYTTLGLRVGRRTKTFIVIRPNGKRITLGHYPQLSLHDARRRIHQTPEPKSTAPLVSEVIEDFLKDHAAKTRLNTQIGTRRLLTRHFQEPHGDKHIDTITAAHLTGITDGLRATPAEAINTHAKLKTLFRWCLRRGIIKENPMAMLPTPAKLASRERVLTDHELQSVLKYCHANKNSAYAAICLLLIYTGLRKTEVHTLTREVITPEKLSVLPHLSKNHQRHDIPNTVQDIIDTRPNLGDALFPKNIHWQRELHDLHAATGTSGYTLHDFRRTLSTRMSDWSICDVATTEAILGHLTGSRNAIQRVYDRSTRFGPMERALTEYRRRLDHLMTAT